MIKKYLLQAQLISEELLKFTISSIFQLPHKNKLPVNKITLMKRKLFYICIRFNFRFR